jgi:heme O synthase-like polyprenyltransferase
VFLRPADRDAGARKLFLFSLAYLPLLLGLLVADRMMANRP